MFHTRAEITLLSPTLLLHTISKSNNTVLKPILPGGSSAMQFRRYKPVFAFGKINAMGYQLILTNYVA